MEVEIKLANGKWIGLDSLARGVSVCPGLDEAAVALYLTDTNDIVAARCSPKLRMIHMYASSLGCYVDAFC